jgi:phosphoglycerol geranylgeranyltransferase
LDNILAHIKSKKREGIKMLAHLIDPDKLESQHKLNLVEAYSISAPDLIFYGGSLMTSNRFESGLNWIKDTFPNIPVIIFPGDTNQVSSKADALLLLSLVSGRNPDLLIGKHVLSSFKLKELNIPLIPTAYLLVDGGVATTANYMSFSAPIPANKPEIAAATALAAEQLGMQLAYFDCGSGAQKHITPDFIKKIRASIDLPIIVGGGIKNAESANKLWSAGADIIVIGQLFEEDPSALKAFKNLSFRTTLN